MAALVLATLALLNWIGRKARSRAQEATSLVKTLGLIALVIAAFTISLKPGTASLFPGNLLAHPNSIFLGLMLALQGVVITYDGWYSPIYFVEEDRKIGSCFRRRRANRTTKPTSLGSRCRPGGGPTESKRTAVLPRETMPLGWK